MDRRLPVLAALALVAPVLVASVASAQGAPEGEDWRVDRRLTPGEGFQLTTQGSVDGQPATLERGFALDDAELTMRYTLGEEPDRQLEAQIAIEGVYVFADDGDGRFDVSDRVVDHQRVDPDQEAHVTPVRTPAPTEAARAVVGLEDNGRVALTLTTSSGFAMLRGDDLSPTDTRLNVTVAGVTAEADRHVAVALDARAPQVSQPGEAFLRLDGDRASLAFTSMGAITPEGPSEASALTEDTAEGERALAFLAGPSGPTSSHEAQASLVHTSADLSDVRRAVEGQPGTFLLGLLGASVLVGATAWRKLEG